MRNWKYPIWIVAALTVIWLGSTYMVRFYRLGCIDYAIGRMRGLTADENNFAINHPANGYSCKLSDITYDKVVADGKTMYDYSFEVSDCRRQIPNGPYTSFRLIAHPKNTKLPMYCADETNSLKVDYTSSGADCIKNGEPF